MIKKEQVIKVLKTVEDPELRIDVYTLGLIYDIKIDKDKVKIKMTLTTPLCPYGPMLIDMVEDSIKKIKGVKDVKTELVFDPPWQPNDELRTMFGI
jgi:metal-sulfur cluster biosynthetic enzyme